MNRLNTHEIFVNGPLATNNQSITTLEGNQSSSVSIELKFYFIFQKQHKSVIHFLLHKDYWYNIENNVFIVTTLHKFIY